MAKPRIHGKELYEIVEITSPGAPEEDDIERLIRERERLLAKRLKLKMMERMLAEEEAELRKLVKEAGLGRSQQEQQQPEVPPALAALGIVNKDDLKELLRDRDALRAILLINALQNPQLQGVALLALTLESLASRSGGGGGGNGAPHISDRIIEKLVEAALRQQPQQQGGTDASLLIKLLDMYDKRFGEMVKTLAEKMESIARSLNRPGIIDTILMDDKLREAVARIFGGVDPRVEIELKKLEIELERLRQQAELERKRLELEERREERRRRLLKYALRKLGEGIASALEAVEEEHGGARVLGRARCPVCGSEVLGPIGSVVTCPSCGTRLLLRPAGGAGASGGPEAGGEGAGEGRGEASAEHSG